MLREFGDEDLQVSDVAAGDVEKLSGEEIDFALHGSHGGAEVTGAAVGATDGVEGLVEGGPADLDGEGGLGDGAVDAEFGAGRRPQFLDELVDRSGPIDRDAPRLLGRGEGRQDQPGQHEVHPRVRRGPYCTCR